MGKTTNILDLNNRLEKVEKEHVAQNNYNSLKNRPKINGNLLTGDKTGAQLGLAEAQDVGDLSALTTTDKSSAVGAINEVKSGLTGKHGVSEYNLLVTLAEFDGILSYGAYLNTAYNALQGFINSLPNGSLIHIDRMNIDGISINNPSSRIGANDTTVGSILFASFETFDIVSGHLVVRKVDALSKTYEMIDNGVYSDISSNVPAAGGVISVMVTIYTPLS